MSASSPSPVSESVSASDSSRPLCSRSFQWVSSVDGDEAVLRRLHRRMMDFYSTLDSRASYQDLLDDFDDRETVPAGANTPNAHVPAYVCANAPSRVLEVGCGGGWTYRQLRNRGYEGSYVGVEVADYLVEANRERHPEATWTCASAYDLPVDDASVDLCYSMWVLEHLVYPKQGLNEMLRLVRPGGELVLVYPDFVAAGRLASQQVGWSAGPTATEKLRQGRLVDAVVSLYDSRIRLPRALSRAVDDYGPFPVNTAPLCLCHPARLTPDLDAVYIASKAEVAAWAREQGHRVSFPQGQDGLYHDNAFLVIEKTR